VKHTELGPGQKALERGSTFKVPRHPMKQKMAPKKRRAISPASKEQRSKVTLSACVKCGRPSDEFRVDPAHLIDRSLGGCDDPLCVVPLCRLCHTAYDEQGMDLLPSLEPRYRAELAHAVEHVGLVACLQRVTNSRYVEDRSAA
jgi:hypothetical protein